MICSKNYKFFEMLQPSYDLFKKSKIFRNSFSQIQLAKSKIFRNACPNTTSNIISIN